MAGNGTSSGRGGEPGLAGDPRHKHRTTAERTDRLLAASGEAVAVQASQTLRRAVDCLLNMQHASGYWCAELEGDSILQSEYILLKWMLGQENAPDARERLPKIAAYLRRQQRPDGTWVQYPGGAIDLSATAKGYFALKLMGDDPDSPHMARAREQVRKHGGAERCNSFTKFYFAALGQISYDALPSIPPEIVYLPRWFYFHLDKLSAWTRTMIQPLSIVTTHRPCRALPTSLSIDELYVDAKLRHRLVPAQDRPHPVWARAFLFVDRGLKLLDRAGMTDWRTDAIRSMERWMLDHLGATDGLGAIFPPMVYIQVALRCLGYPDDHPVLIKARKDLDDLMIHDTETDEIRIQPCFSPVWDTGIAAYALAEAGLDQQHEPMRRAQWLVSKECRAAADWQANVKQHVEPSGWYFEFNNPFYPDVDDTAMVAMALKRIGGTAAEAAAERGVNWMLAMQNDDGGWAAFDREAHDRPLLEHVPFADHNAIQDPSCPDITGRVLECLSWHGYDISHPAVQCAIAFIRKHQEPDGPWFGRWGVNYIYGTWQVISGLSHIGQDMNADWIQKAGQWLVDHQQSDGSFGESATTYEDESLRGTGPATASQTAWAVMTLLAIRGANDPAVVRGIQWLCDTQLGSGDWDEPWFTGTGFPRVFYLRYHLYRLYFPVMCIGKWLRLHDRRPELELETQTT